MVYISPTINILSLSIRKIGRRLLRDFNEIENLQNSVKGTYTFLVKTKFKLKKVIKFELKKIKGNLDVFFLDEKPNIINEDAWIVDAINGSENFQKGIPHFCISISLMEKKEIKISVIYDPIKDELYYAQKEKGAYLNDFRLKLLENSSCNLSTLSLSDISLIEQHKTLKLITNEFEQIRMFGSALLDFCYLANGKIDAAILTNNQKNIKKVGKIISQEANATILECINGTEVSIICNKNIENKLRNILTEKVEI